MEKGTHLKQMYLSHPKQKEAKNLYLFGNFIGEGGVQDVPDPYYGRINDFQNVYRMVEEGCENLLKTFKKE